MEGGRALGAGSGVELPRRFWPNPMVTFDAEDPRLLDRVAAFPGVAGYRRDPSGVRIELDDLRRLPDMVASLVADGVRLTRVEPHEPTLEDLYFTIRRQAGVGRPEDPAADGGQVMAPGRRLPGGQEGRDGPGRPDGNGAAPPLAPIRTGHGDLPPLGAAGRPAPSDRGAAR